MRSVVAALITLLLVGISLPATPVAADHGANHNAHGACNAEMFGNEDFELWFQGKKGFFNVVNNMSTGGGYSYKTLSVREVDGDGNTIASAKLNNANAQASNCTVEEDDTNLTVTLSSNECISPGKSSNCKVGEALVTFVYHYNKSNNAAKFDLFVDDWDWNEDAVDNEHLLVFDFKLMAQGGDSMEGAENGVGFQNSTGAHTAYIEWAPNATVRYGNGTEDLAIVESDIDMNGDNTTAIVTLAFTNVTAGYVDLEYDPIVGVGFYLIVAGILITDPTRLGLLDLAFEVIEDPADSLSSL